MEGDLCICGWYNLYETVCWRRKQFILLGVHLRGVCSCVYMGILVFVLVKCILPDSKALGEGQGRGLVVTIMVECTGTIGYTSFGVSKD